MTAPQDREIDADELPATVDDLLVKLDELLDAAVDDDPRLLNPTMQHGLLARVALVIAQRDEALAEVAHLRKHAPAPLPNKTP